MAMNPKLSEGSILLYYPEIQEFYGYRSYRSAGRQTPTKYLLNVNALYVYNRRSRTNGAQVPVALEPYLHALKVRTNKFGSSKNIIAVGCATRNIYREEIRGDIDNTQAFRDAFKNVKELAGESFDDRFFQNDFVETFLETKVKNKDKKFVLYTPKEKLQAFHPVREIVELEESELWTESRFNQERLRR